jgi:hypothetical protein
LISRNDRSSTSRVVDTRNETLCSSFDRDDAVLVISWAWDSDCEAVFDAALVAL